MKRFAISIVFLLSLIVVPATTLFSLAASSQLPFVNSVFGAWPASATTTLEHVVRDIFADTLTLQEFAQDVEWGQEHKAFAYDRDRHMIVGPEVLAGLLVKDPALQEGAYAFLIYAIIAHECFHRKYHDMTKDQRVRFCKEQGLHESAQFLSAEDDLLQEEAAVLAATFRLQAKQGFDVQAKISAFLNTPVPGAEGAHTTYADKIFQTAEQNPLRAVFKAKFLPWLKEGRHSDISAQKIYDALKIYDVTSHGQLQDVVAGDGNKRFRYMWSVALQALRQSAKRGFSSAAGDLRQACVAMNYPEILREAGAKKTFPQMKKIAFAMPEQRKSLLDGLQAQAMVLPYSSIDDVQKRLALPPYVSVVSAIQEKNYGEIVCKDDGGHLWGMMSKKGIVCTFDYSGAQVDDMVNTLLMAFEEHREDLYAFDRASFIKTMDAYPRYVYAGLLCNGVQYRFSKILSLLPALGFTRIQDGQVLINEGYEDLMMLVAKQWAFSNTEWSQFIHFGFVEKHAKGYRVREEYRAFVRELVAIYMRHNLRYINGALTKVGGFKSLTFGLEDSEYRAILEQVHQDMWKDIVQKGCFGQIQLYYGGCNLSLAPALMEHELLRKQGVWALESAAPMPSMLGPTPTRDLAHHFDFKGHIEEYREEMDEKNIVLPLKQVKLLQAPLRLVRAQGRTLYFSDDKYPGQLIAYKILKKGEQAYNLDYENRVMEYLMTQQPDFPLAVKPLSMDVGDKKYRVFSTPLGAIHPDIAAALRRETQKSYHEFALREQDDELVFMAYQVIDPAFLTYIDDIADDAEFCESFLKNMHTLGAFAAKGIVHTALGRFFHDNPDNPDGRPWNPMPYFSRARHFQPGQGKIANMLTAAQFSNMRAGGYLADFAEIASFEDLIDLSKPASDIWKELCYSQHGVLDYDFKHGFEDYGAKRHLFYAMNAVAQNLFAPTIIAARRWALNGTLDHLTPQKIQELAALLRQGYVEHYHAYTGLAKVDVEQKLKEWRIDFEGIIVQLSFWLNPARYAPAVVGHNIPSEIYRDPALVVYPNFLPEQEMLVMPAKELAKTLPRDWGVIVVEAPQGKVALAHLGWISGLKTFDFSSLKAKYTKRGLALQLTVGNKERHYKGGEGGFVLTVTMNEQQGQDGLSDDVVRSMVIEDLQKDLRMINDGGPPNGPCTITTLMDALTLVAGNMILDRFKPVSESVDARGTVATKA